MTSRTQVQPRHRTSRATGLCALLLLAACGSDDEAASTTTQRVDTTSASTAPPSTDAPGTTAADTTPATEAPTTTEAAGTTSPTTAAPASTDAPTTTAGEPVTEGLDPPCVERDVQTPRGGGETFGSFGPLGAEPALVIDLPAARVPGDAENDAPSTTAAVVSGGVVLAVRSRSFESFDGSMLAMVTADGETSWVRCLPGVITDLHASLEGSVAMVRTRDGDEGAGQWHTVALATGDVATADLFGTGEWDDAPALATDELLLFAPPDDVVVDPSVHRLVRVDLATGVADEIPLPAEAAGIEAFMLQFEVHDRGDVALLDPSASAPAVVSVLRHGDDAWTSDPAVLADAVGVRAAFGFDEEGARFVGYDAFGQVVWTSQDVVPFSGEAFVLAESDSESGSGAGAVAVVAGCWGEVEEELCNDHEVGGLDLATGAVLWHLDGDRAVGPVGDGFALVTAGEGDGGEQAGEWLLIDTDTGEIVDDSQRWTGVDFGTLCCGEEEVFWTARFGGVVVHTDHRRVFVWYPADAGLGTHSVTLP